jgi:hypothetical protein
MSAPCPGVARPSGLLLPLALAVLALTLLACTGSRGRALDTPQPRPLPVWQFHALRGGQELVATETTVEGMLKRVSRVSGTDRAELALAQDAEEVRVSLTWPAGLEPLQALVGRSVRAEAASSAGTSWLRVADPADAAAPLLLLAVVHLTDKLPALLPAEVAPPGLSVRRVGLDTEIHTRADQNDCIGMSVHHTLEVRADGGAAVLAPGAWGDLEWGGYFMRAWNQDAWTWRRGSCREFRGSGLVLALVRAPQPAPGQTPRSPAP